MKPLEKIREKDFKFFYVICVLLVTISACKDPRELISGSDITVLRGATLIDFNLFDSGHQFEGLTLRLMLSSQRLPSTVIRRKIGTCPFLSKLLVFKKNKIEKELRTSITVKF